jgi:general secretion pathway protein K
MAGKPVIRCLSEQIDDDLAQRVIDYRKSSPFKEPHELQKVSGFTSIYNSISGHLTATGNVFSIKASASSGAVKRIIETVLSTDKKQIEYWKEY